MYIVDRLNEVILESYHIQIESEVCVFEEDKPTSNLVDFYHNPSATYKSHTNHLPYDLKAYLLDYIELFVGLTITPQTLKETIELEKQNDGFCLSTSDDGSLQVYDTFITVTINGTKLSNIILYAVIFGIE